MAEPTLINLDGFTEQKHENVTYPDGREMTRVYYDRGLIIETTVNSATQQVSLHSNFQWKHTGKTWTPDLTAPNPNF